jgi:hypothetical protein
VFGLPLLKPPYGSVVAVDLKTGERLWTVPNGNTPDNIGIARTEAALNACDRCVRESLTGTQLLHHGT